MPCGTLFTDIGRNTQVKIHLTTCLRSIYLFYQYIYKEIVSLTLVHTLKQGVFHKDKKL